jgi:phosphatidate cytidylyltransferase
LADKISTRIAVGLSVIVVIAAFLFADHWTAHAWGLDAIVLTFIVWGCIEMVRLFQHADVPARRRELVWTSILLVAAQALGNELSIEWLKELEGPILVFFAFVLLLPPLFGLPSRARLLGMAASVFSLFYVWFLGSYVIRLRYLPEIGESAAIYAIVVAKGTDIFAYFSGKAFGKTKLIPNISPGKTVAGFVGALVGSVLITVGFCSWTPLGRALPLRFAPAIGILLGVLVVAGDLVESLFKRSAELKDSARLLPTFGGILDLADSILTAAPAVYILIDTVARLRRLGFEVT